GSRRNSGREDDELSDANAERVKLAPILTSIILTVLLLWMVGKTAGVFLLLFIATILSLYLGAVRDFLAKRFHFPDRPAFFVAVVGTIVALASLIGLLVPPVFAQPRALLDVVLDSTAHWEEGIDNFVA